MKYSNLKKQLMDSLEDQPFPELPAELQKSIFWEFGNKEEHFKYRDAVMLEMIIDKNELPSLSFLKE